MHLNSFLHRAKDPPSLGLGLQSSLGTWGAGYSLHPESHRRAFFRKYVKILESFQTHPSENMHLMSDSDGYFLVSVLGPPESKDADGTLEQKAEVRIPPGSSDMGKGRDCFT